ncbi:MAG: efflux RND transporter periplasmic adaptor subunit [Burkholderiales bacterium]|nr:efflux RND transporter periplasmic adaptor subunit [Burkholderiales bacterium]
MTLARWAGGLVLVVAVAVAAAVVGVRWLAAPSAPVSAAAPREPDVLRFAPGAPQLASLQVMPAEQAPLPLAEPLNGRIVYNENATARVSSPIAGRVTRLARQPGDAVKAGDLLLTLDSPELAAAVADVEKAAADESRKRLAFERAQKLVEGGVAAQKDLENARADYEQARAETERARLRLGNLTPRVREGASYGLTAPIAGIVAERKVNPGMQVRPDLPDPLFIITDPARVWVTIDLPERDLVKVAPGRRAIVEVDAYPGARFPTTIEYVGVAVDAATRRVQVRGAIANPDGKLKPEMYARVTLVADDANRAVRVPNSALVTQGLYSYVFVETAPGVFQRRRVVLGLQEREWSYLASGVQPGEQIVARGALLLNSELAAGG